MIGVGDTVTRTVALVDVCGDTIAGQVAADFTINLTFGVSVAPEPVFLVESDVPGQYVITFIPTQPGTYSLHVEHNETEMIYTSLVEVATDAIARSMVVLDGSNAFVTAWLERAGRGVDATISATVTVYDVSGAVVFSVSSSAPDARGVFNMTSSSVVVTANRPYTTVVSVTDTLGTVETYEATAVVG